MPIQGYFAAKTPSTAALCAWFMLSIAGFIALPAVEALAHVSPMGNVLCTLVRFFYGNLGRGLASLAIVILGIGAMLGKVSWGMAATVATGISVMFGAPTILWDTTSTAVIIDANGCR